ncbi:MAG: hypothetical protein BWY59_00685 [Verrucomicrobia bacterium ADurb.Bin345]|nr:MAG: hypothetical protein BWY59_00685 [Verrucomicrobia bacterium ADurb.Bin345]
MAAASSSDPPSFRQPSLTITTAASVSPRNSEDIWRTESNTSVAAPEALSPSSPPARDAPWSKRYRMTFECLAMRSSSPASPAAPASRSFATANRGAVCPSDWASSMVMDFDVSTSTAVNSAASGGPIRTQRYNKEMKWPRIARSGWISS